MVLIKWDLGWIRAGGRFLLPYAVHTTRSSNCIVKIEVSTHSLLFLCMRQSRPTTGHPDFLHFGPRSHLTCCFSFSVLQTDFVITEASFFPCPTFPLSLIKMIAEAAFLPKCLSVQFERPLLQPKPQSKPPRCGMWKYLASLWLRDWKNALNW